MSNKNCKYLVVDTETTGLHTAKNGLIQVAALALDNKLKIIDQYTIDINPPDGYQISPESLGINGFTLERIAAGVSYEQFCHSFIEFVRQNFEEVPICIGQFFPFDFAFLDYVFTTVGLDKILNSEIMTNQFIDTKSLVLSLNLKAELKGDKIPFPITSLSKPGGLKDKFGIWGEDFTAHDALGDVMATRAVLIKLMDYLP